MSLSLNDFLKARKMIGVYTTSIITLQNILIHKSMEQARYGIPTQWSILSKLILISLIFNITFMEVMMKCRQLHTMKEKVSFQNHNISITNSYAYKCFINYYSLIMIISMLN